MSTASAVALDAASSTPTRHAAAATTPTDTSGSTRDADTDRTGWYPDETNLSPQLVAGGTFGQLFDTSVNGSVYGQPLVDDSQLLVNTEKNYSYGLDPTTGAILWSRQYGNPGLASDLGCADLAPNMGVTSTPVVDQATEIEYLVDDEYVSGDSGPEAYYMHALQLNDHGAEAPGFPVQIQGTASNNPAVSFNPNLQLQRPGLLLMNGVVYVAFGAHCDDPPWEGWVAGVSETGHLTTLWTTASITGSTGAGIWMSGGGLVSDGSGQILFATGNGASNGAGPIAGSTPPADLGEAVVRLAVQPDGSLKATDFFSPYDASTLDQNDIDFGSGSPVALPDAYFGTSTDPHLAVEVGKEGYVYLLNRDNLGGVGEGPSGTDEVVGRYGPNGGVWSSPAVWPGDGGWIYIPTASGSVSAGGTSGLMDAYQYGVTGSGTPTLNLAGTSSDAFGFGSSAPVVTSSGTTSGTALMWTVWSPDGTGVGAQLRAYDPVPVNGQLQLVWSAPVGTASKFNPPGVAGNRLYVGTRAGSVIGFGAPVSAPVTAPSPTFPATVIGHSSTQTLTITANSAVTVSSLVVSGAFSLGAPSTKLPATLAAGASLTVPVTFTPVAAGPAGGGVTIATAASGNTDVTLTGSGEVNGPSLTSSTSGVSFGGIPPGQQSSQTVSMANNGSQPLTVSSVVDPAAPFSVSGAPAAGAVLQPGQQVVVNLTFAPTANGSYSQALTIDSTGGNLTVAVTGSSDAPALLQVSPPSLQFGAVPVGHTVTKTFTLTNVGGSNLTITKSKPPVLGPFTATSTLPEGSTIQPGQSQTETIAFTPSGLGTTSDQWVITGDDGQGLRSVGFSGSGVLGDPGAGGWDFNGSAAAVGGTVQLTSTEGDQAGSAIAPTLVSSDGLGITFTTVTSTKRSVGEGTALVLGQSSDPTTSLGAAIGGRGFAGIPGVAVVLGTSKAAGDPSANFVGITNGPQTKHPNKLNWLATTTKVGSLRGTVQVRVTLSSGALTVYVDGASVLTAPVAVGPSVRLGFSGSTAVKPGVQAVEGVSVSADAPATLVGDPTAGGWTLNGSSELTGGAVALTQAGQVDQAGTAFWPTPLSSSDLTTTFATAIGGGGTTGADGLTLVLADPSTAPTAVGADGGGLGFSGIKGVAVALDTYQNVVNPSSNFVGITNGPINASVPDQLNWLATDTSVPALRATHTFSVALVAGVLTVDMDGTQILSTDVTVGPDVLLGFSGGTGGTTDTHAVSHVSITAEPRTSEAIADPTAGGWTVNGSSVLTGGALQLTPSTPDFEAGTAFWPTPVSSSDLTAEFTGVIGNGSAQGADGMTLVLADSGTSPTTVGAIGGGLGFSGIPGIAVALDTYQNAVNPSSNFIGVTDGPTTPSVPDELHWLATANVTQPLRSTNSFTVTLDDGILTVTMDGTQVLSTPVAVGPEVLVGFSGGTGMLTDTHSVEGVSIHAA